MKSDLTAKLANEALAPLLAYRDRMREQNYQRGVITSVAKLIKARTGRKVRLQTVAAWLHEDPKRRQQPRFGMGLLLVEIGNRIMEDEMLSRLEHKGQP